MGGSKLKSDSSPSPSARHISNRRINTNETNSSLRSKTKTYGSVENTSDDTQDHKIHTSSFQGPPSFNNNDAIVLDGHHTSSSQHPAISEYFPGNTSLTWVELLPYYLPICSWVNEYCVDYFLGDLIGGVSLSTFQIPLVISYSTSLAKVPITCGLYSLGVAPLIYMLFGSVPQMITGPEAPMSLIIGQAVEPLLHHTKKTKITASEYVVAITFVSGATLLGFGLGRFGFLDNVLCESLLKGFICGVGAVMIINSLIPSLGLEELLRHSLDESNETHSPFQKLEFVYENFNKAHRLTLCVSALSFLFIMAIRRTKKLSTKSSNRWLKLTIYVPEILILIVTTTILCREFQWAQNGLSIVGEISDASSDLVLFNPLSSKHLKLAKKLSTSGFVCAMLGFFESTTASKSLGSTYDLPISSNRELVALGAINLVCSVFGGLPAFGGYGRSKINAITARTTFSGAIMGTISLLTVRYISGLVHFIPKCVLSVTTAVIGVSLMSEGPREVAFHWRSGGYSELFTFTITILATLFFSIEAGIAVGLIYSLIRVIKNSAESNIQILGRVPGTNTFLNADLANDYISASSATLPDERRHSQLNLFTDKFRPLNFQALEEIEGCLIIKIPEPLTFTNASDLRSRLKRLEMYGSTKAHPASKRSRDASMSKYMIFDLEGMAYLDSSAAHLLYQSLQLYDRRNIKSFFVKVSNSRELRERLQKTGITGILVSSLQSLKTGTEHGCFDGSSEFSPETLPKKHHNDNGLNELAEIESGPFMENIGAALRLIDFYEQRAALDA